MHVLENSPRTIPVTLFQASDNLSVFFTVSQLPLANIVLPGKIVEAMLYGQDEFFQGFVVRDLQINVVKLQIG